MKYFLTILLLSVTTFLFAQGNPLFSGSGAGLPTYSNDSLAEDSVVVATPSEEAPSVSVFNSFIKINAGWQKEIKNKLADLSADYSSQGNLGALGYIFLLAFLYGLFHSLGPGHGKVFVFSYILTEKPNLFKAIGTSYAIAFVHGISGMILALTIVFSMKTYSSESASITQMSDLMTQLSFAIITLIGIVLTVKYLRGHAHTHDHSPKKFIPFVLSVGLVPCPGTIITITFLNSMGLLSVGVIASLFIILGMGAVISVISLVSVFAREWVQRLYDRDDNPNRIYRIMSLTGSILLIVLGASFLIGS